MQCTVFSYLLNGKIMLLNQTWANYGPRAKSGPPVLLFWPAGIFRNLNFHHELSGSLFFPFEITDGSDFQKISFNGAKLK